MNPNILIVPSGLPGIAPTHIDITSINRTEARVDEIAIVTRGKAPELLAAFNKAFNDASKCVTTLELSAVHARKTVDRIRSKLILDKIPTLLRERGLATAKSPMGSEDLRQAVLDGDDEYRAAIDDRDIIDCYLALMKAKVRGFVMSFDAVKRVIGDLPLNKFASPINAGNEDVNANAGETLKSDGKRTGFASVNRYAG